MLGRNGKSGFSESVLVAVVSMTGLALGVILMQTRDEERRSRVQVETQRASDRAALELARREALMATQVEEVRASIE